MPTEYRRRLGLEAGDEIIMHLDEEGLHLDTPAQAVVKAQAWCGATFRRGGAYPES